MQAGDAAASGQTVCVAPLTEMLHLVVLPESGNKTNTAHISGGVIVGFSCEMIHLSPLLNYIATSFMQDVKHETP